MIQILMRVKHAKKTNTAKQKGQHVAKAVFIIDGTNQNRQQDNANKYVQNQLPRRKHRGM